ncbi:MAG: type II secretion system protein [Clostridia bacterium]|nr:type II secretion system protein [Clostridia bacterium]
MRKTKRNSGFSVMETVIALAMIAIVTIAALSVVLSAISARVKQANISEAQDFAHNILECFKASENSGQFTDNVEFAGIEGLEYSGGSKYRYVAENKFAAVLNADFTSSEFEIDIRNNKDEVIISFSYEKGAK